VSLGQTFELFFELDGRRGRRGPVVSGSGLKVHVDATCHSIRSGTPGVVPETYLNGLPGSRPRFCRSGCQASSTVSDKTERRRQRHPAQIRPFLMSVFCAISIRAESKVIGLSQVRRTHRTSRRVCHVD
jgi:hypothetical protein